MSGLVVHDLELLFEPTPASRARPSVSEEATQLARQLAAQHLEVLAQCAADAVEGRRQHLDPRIERALAQASRLAREMEDDTLVTHLERLGILLSRLFGADVADHALYARRLRDTVMDLGSLAGGDAAVKLRAICVRRRGLNPLAARLKNIPGIGDRRLARMWSAGLLTLDNLVDAEPDELMSVAGISRPVAHKVITVAREHAQERAGAVAELLDEAIAEARQVASSRGLAPHAQARLHHAAADARRALERWMTPSDPTPTPTPTLPPPLPMPPLPMSSEARAVPPVVSVQPLARLGAGAEAEVLRAIQRGPIGIERRVVLKRLWQAHASEQRWRECLRAEARLLARVDHAHVVTLLDVLNPYDEPELVLELIEGTDLRRFLRAVSEAGERLPVARVVRLGLDLADALALVHRIVIDGRPLAHGDIAPCNVMLGYDGRVKLIDFGTAALLQVDGSTHGPRGHAAYLAPEQLVGDGRPTPRSDQFALATMLWEAMTTRRLFAGVDRETTFRNIAAHRVHDRFTQHSYVPASLRDILLRALRFVPGERWPDMAAFRDALVSWLQEHGSGLEHDGLGQLVRRLVPTPFELPLDVIEPPPLPFEARDA